MTTKSYLNNGEEVEIEFYYLRGFRSRKSFAEMDDDNDEIEMRSVVRVSDNVEVINKITTKEFDRLLDSCWENWRERQ